MPRALRALLTLVVAGVLGVAGAGAASASAYGATPIPSFSYVGSDGQVKNVPPGCLLIHTIIGTGRDISSQTASVDCAGVAAMRSGLFCDAEISFTFSDASGTPVAGKSREREAAGCRTLGIRLTNPEGTFSYDSSGKSCVSLTVDAKVRAKSCHYIGS